MPPLVVLPFPGSVSVSCTYQRRSPQQCSPRGKPGVSVESTADVHIGRSRTTLDATGCPHQTLSIGTTLKLVANAAAKGARAGGSLSGYLGGSLDYSVTVSPQSAEDIEHHRRPPPNPVDPRTIRAGESVELTAEFYAGTGGRAKYRNIQLELGYERGRRVSSGVQRVSPTTVRVMVGDEDFVRQALSLGVDLGSLGISVGNTKELSSGKLHAIDIDISSEAGWKAYQSFLDSGRLPRAGTAGTSAPTRSRTVDYSDVSQIEGKLGGVKFGTELGSSEGRWTETRNADGSIDYVANVRYGTSGFAIRSRKDANGRPVGRPSYSLLLQDVDSSMIEGLQQRTGQRVGAQDGNVRIDFTAAQLQQLRQIALSKLADKVDMNGRRPSAQEIAQSLRDHNGVLVIDGVRYGFDPLLTGLAMAKTPDQMLVELYQSSRSGAGVVQRLVDLITGKSRDLSATVVTPHC